jgi:hypothetical protein
LQKKKYTRKTTNPCQIQQIHKKTKKKQKSSKKKSKTNLDLFPPRAQSCSNSLIKLFSAETQLHAQVDQHTNNTIDRQHHPQSRYLHFSLFSNLTHPSPDEDCFQSTLRGNASKSAQENTQRGKNQPQHLVIECLARKKNYHRATT